MLNTPEIQTEETLAAKVNPISNAIKQLAAQVTRAEIVDEDTNAMGGDLYKIITNQINKSEDARKFLVQPLNDHVKTINAEFKPNKESLELLKKTLKDKLDAYAQKKQAEVDRVAKEEREAAEAAALERATEAEADGNKELANDIVEQAAELPDSKSKGEISRGDYGSSTSTRTDWKGECVSVKELCAAIGRGDLPEDFITVNQARLNKFALDKKIEKTNFGIKLYKKISASIR